MIAAFAISGKYRRGCRPPCTSMSYEFVVMFRSGLSKRALQLLVIQLTAVILIEAQHVSLFAPKQLASTGAELSAAAVEMTNEQANSTFHSFAEWIVAYDSALQNVSDAEVGKILAADRLRSLRWLSERNPSAVIAEMMRLNALLPSHWEHLHLPIEVVELLEKVFLGVDSSIVSLCGTANTAESIALGEDNDDIPGGCGCERMFQMNDIRRRFFAIIPDSDPRASVEEEYNVVMDAIILPGLPGDDDELAVAVSADNGSSGLSPLTVGDNRLSPYDPEGIVAEPIVCGGSYTPINTKKKPNKVLIIQVDFSDLQGTVRQLDDVDSIHEWVQDFYVHNSQDQTTLDIELAPGTYRMANGKSWYLTGTSRLTNILNEASNQLSANYPQYDVCDYDMTFAAFPYEASLWWAGLAVVGYRDGWLNGPNGYGNRILAHEIGHNYGSRHSQSLKPSVGTPENPTKESAQQFNSYGDPYCVMGSGTGDFNTQWKATMGWITEGAGDVARITSPSAARYDYILYPHDLETSWGVGPLSIEVYGTASAGTDNGVIYYLSFRQGDAMYNCGNTCRNYASAGLEIRKYYPVSATTAYLLDMKPNTNGRADAFLQPSQTYEVRDGDIHFSNMGTVPCPQSISNCLHVAVFVGSSTAITPTPSTPASGVSASPTPSKTASSSGSKTASVSQAPSRSASSSTSRSASPSRSPSRSRTASRSSSRSASASETRSVSASRSASRSASPSRTGSTSMSSSLSKTRTQSITSSVSRTASISPSRSVSASRSHSASATEPMSPSSTSSRSPSATRSRSATASPSGSMSRSPSSSRTASSSRSSTPSRSASKSLSASSSPSESSSVSRSASRSSTASRSQTPTMSVTPSTTSSRSSSASRSSTGTSTYSKTMTPSTSGTTTGTVTESSSPSVTITSSKTTSADPSMSPSMSPSTSGTITISETGTSAPSESATATVSGTGTMSATLTAASSVSPSTSGTLSNTVTHSETRTASHTYLASASSTPVSTPTTSVTPSTSASPSVSGTFSSTMSHSGTPSSASTVSQTVTISGTPTPLATISGSPSSAGTVSGTATFSGTPTPLATISGSPSSAMTASSTMTISASPTPLATGSGSPSSAMTASGTVTMSGSATPPPTGTRAPTTSTTAQPSTTTSPSAMLSPSSSSSSVATGTATLSPTVSISGTSVPSGSASGSAAATPSASAAETSLPTTSGSATVTGAPTTSSTVSSSKSTSGTVTTSRTPSSSGTTTSSTSRTPSQSESPTASVSVTSSRTSSKSASLSPSTSTSTSASRSPSVSKTTSMTPSRSPSVSPSSTATASRTPTPSRSSSQTSSSSVTASATAAPSRSSSSTSSISHSASVSKTTSVSATVSHSPTSTPPVDECALGTHDCDVHATCTDTFPGYSCKCNEFWVGSGYECVDFDECGYEVSHNVPIADRYCPNSRCINLVGEAPDCMPCPTGLVGPNCIYEDVPYVEDDGDYLRTEVVELHVVDIGDIIDPEVLENATLSVLVPKEDSDDGAAMAFEQFTGDDTKLRDLNGKVDNKKKGRFSGLAFSLSVFNTTEARVLDEYVPKKPVPVLLPPVLKLGVQSNEQLKLHYWEEPTGMWRDALGGCPDAELPDQGEVVNDTLKLYTCHFSQFAVLAVSNPSTEPLPLWMWAGIGVGAVGIIIAAVFTVMSFKQNAKEDQPVDLENGDILGAQVSINPLHNGPRISTQPAQNSAKGVQQGPPVPAKKAAAVEKQKPLPLRPAPTQRTPEVVPSPTPLDRTSTSAAPNTANRRTPNSAASTLTRLKSRQLFAPLESPRTTPPLSPSAVSDVSYRSTSSPRPVTSPRNLPVPPVSPMFRRRHELFEKSGPSQSPR